ncbi:hypothetical protein CBP51_11200 [Cellvibrio mixtus]|uniref:TonB C-terminal domain-containing protein n=1 Tax=Cellvibrio mixtus TaxID=39650 RepID=A0A266QCB0_9GAMM|nr:AgmX/PglI C-terminal domain-containing protein [Cellvibrio mixtus]OZY87507.1 hypothetical protein CBP51_11200 [Cellvibrio mixtus]
MSEVINYKKLALEWQPKATASDHFKWIMLAVFTVVITLAIIIAFIKVPERGPRQVAKVPDRIANFIAERPKKIIPPAPTPEPKPVLAPRKKPTPQPTLEQPAQVRVERKRPSEIDKQPLSVNEQQARNVAQQSGLLALANEMRELTDTSEVNNNIRAKLHDRKITTEAATHKIDLTTTTSQSNIDAEKITSKVNLTELQQRDINNKTTAATERAEREKTAIAKNNNTGGRAPTDLTSVFDKNRPGLYSLYERERRKNASLKGRVVFELTILPSGKVASVKIVSSDLNNPALEARIMGRIKLFTFAPISGESVTVSYPVEFLP